MLGHPRKVEIKPAKVYEVAARGDRRELIVYDNADRQRGNTPDYRFAG